MPVSTRANQGTHICKAQRWPVAVPGFPFGVPGSIWGVSIGHRQDEGCSEAAQGWTTQGNTLPEKSTNDPISPTQKEGHRGNGKWSSNNNVAECLGGLGLVCCALLLKRASVFASNSECVCVCLVFGFPPKRSVRIQAKLGTGDEFLVGGFLLALHAVQKGGPLV